MNDTTFGDSPAAIILAQTLSKRGDSYLTRHVTRLIHRCNQKLADISEISSPITCYYVANLVKNDLFLKVEQSKWDLEIKNFTKNVITAHIRRYIRENYEYKKAIQSHRGLRKG